MTDALAAELSLIDPPRDLWRVSNCSRCGRALLGLSMRDRFTTPPGMLFVAGFVDARPHCGDCLRVVTQGKQPRAK